MTTKPAEVGAAAVPTLKFSPSTFGLNVPAAAATRPTSKRTRDCTLHASGAPASSTSSARRRSGAPGAAGGAPSNTSAAALATMRRYFLATAYSRYCASALVGHGAPCAPSAALHADVAAPPSSPSWRKSRVASICWRCQMGSELKLVKPVCATRKRCTNSTSAALNAQSPFASPCTRHAVVAGVLACSRLRRRCGALAAVSAVPLFTLTLPAPATATAGGTPLPLADVISTATAAPSDTTAGGAPPVARRVSSPTCSAAPLAVVAALEPTSSAVPASGVHANRYAAQSAPALQLTATNCVASQVTVIWKDSSVPVAALTSTGTLSTPPVATGGNCRPLEAPRSTSCSRGFRLGAVLAAEDATAGAAPQTDAATDRRTSAGELA